MDCACFAISIGILIKWAQAIAAREKTNPCLSIAQLLVQLSIDNPLVVRLTVKILMYKRCNISAEQSIIP